MFNRSSNITSLPVAKDSLQGKDVRALESYLPFFETLKEDLRRIGVDDTALDSLSAQEIFTTVLEEVYEFDDAEFFQAVKDKIEVTAISELLIHHTISEEALEHFCTHPSETVRIFVVEYPDVMPSIIKRMLHDSSLTVAASVAASKHLSYEDVLFLSKREEINYPLLWNLTNSNISLVTEEVILNCARLDILPDVYDIFLGLHNTPKSVFEDILNIGTDPVKAAVAACLYTPPDLLSNLSTHVSVQTRRNVAGNPATPLEVLLRLAEDSVPLIRQTVGKNSVYVRYIEDKVGDSIATFVDTLRAFSLAERTAVLRLFSDALYSYEENP